jgi:acetyltransferase-like isoleucine patch superfamily enzyme
MRAMRSSADFPSLRNVKEVLLSDESELSAYGIGLAAAGRGNRLLLEQDQPALGLRLNLGSAVNSTVVIGQSDPFDGVVTIGGTGNIVCFSGVSDRQGRARVKINMDGNNSLAHIGTGFTSIDSHLIIVGNERCITIGADCMLSWGVTLHNYDHHTIFDMESGEELNPPGDLRIGRHVWLGQDVISAGGATVGDGSIIGARSVVTRDIESGCLAVGTPAKVIRTGVSWTRQRFGNADAIAAVRAALAS